MAGLIKVNAVQLGDSATDSQNFLFKTNVDGTAKLSRGAGGNLGDILTVDATGNVRLSQQSTLLQRQQLVTGTPIVTTAGIPVDDTIPQITEGVEWLTLSITPKMIGSTITVSLSTVVSANIAGTTSVAALFLDSNVNAIGASIATSTSSSGYVTALSFRVPFVTTSLSPLTLRVRVGGNQGTTTIGGAGGVRYLGGALTTMLLAEETI